MTKQFVTDYLDEKIKENEEFIVCTFFDVIVKHNLPQLDEKEFVNEAKIKLENMDYKVFLSGDEYTFKYERRIVKENEYFVAIKGVEVK